MKNVFLVLGYLSGRRVLFLGKHSIINKVEIKNHRYWKPKKKSQSQSQSPFSLCLCPPLPNHRGSVQPAALHLYHHHHLYSSLLLLHQLHHLRRGKVPRSSPAAVLRSAVVQTLHICIWNLNIKSHLLISCQIRTERNHDWLLRPKP